MVLWILLQTVPLGSFHKYLPYLLEHLFTYILHDYLPTRTLRYTSSHFPWKGLCPELLSVSLSVCDVVNSISLQNWLVPSERPFIFTDVILIFQILRHPSMSPVLARGTRPSLLARRSTASWRTSPLKRKDSRRTETLHSKSAICERSSKMIRSSLGGKE